jgi:hypothetical protein
MYENPVLIGVRQQRVTTECDAVVQRPSTITRAALPGDKSEASKRLRTRPFMLSATSLGSDRDNVAGECAFVVGEFKKYERTRVSRRLHGNPTDVRVVPLYVYAT